MFFVIEPRPCAPFLGTVSCLVSCSGPQFLPGTGVLSLKSSISLAGSLSPAARPAVRAADPTPRLQRLPATDTPGATICLTPPQEACHILGLDFSCLGAIPGLGGWRIGRKMAGQTPGKVEGWVRVGASGCGCSSAKGGVHQEREDGTYQAIYISPAPPILSHIWALDFMLLGLEPLPCS